VRYRVLDAIMRKGQMVVANAPAALATFRLFQLEDGQRRLYYFKPVESRAPKAALLAQQLQRAKYLPTAPLDSRDHLDPR
jgi:hypothetical protein